MESINITLTEEEVRIIKIAIHKRDKELRDLASANVLDTLLCESIDTNMNHHTNILSKLDK